MARIARHFAVAAHASTHKWHIGSHLHRRSSRLLELQRAYIGVRRLAVTWRAQKARPWQERLQPAIVGTTNWRHRFILLPIAPLNVFRSRKETPVPRHYPARSSTASLALTLVSVGVLATVAVGCSAHSSDGPGATAMGLITTAKAGNVDGVVAYYPTATDAFTAGVERMLATRMVAGARGAKSQVEVVNERIDGDHAVVMLRETGSDGKITVDSLPFVQIDGHWKIPLR